MAYGVDTPTEVGYEYRKKTVKNSKKSHAKEYDGIPHLDAVTWEIPGGVLEKEYLDGPRGGLTDAIMKKRGRLELLGNSTLVHSGKFTLLRCFEVFRPTQKVLQIKETGQFLTCPCPGPILGCSTQFVPNVILMER